MWTEWESPIGSEKYLIVQAALPVHLLDYFLWNYFPFNQQITVLEHLLQKNPV